MEKSHAQRQEQIAQVLLGKSGGCAFAWVEHENMIYWARVPFGYSGPVTATTKLIQFLFDDKVDHSFFILRNRIFSTDILTPLSLGMVKLAAKRATGQVTPKDHHLSLNAQFVELGGPEQHLISSRHSQLVDWTLPVQIQSLAQAHKLLQELIREIPRGPILHDYNREIAAILCDASGCILSWGVNSNAKNKTLHAEVMMIQDYYQRFQKPLPEGSRLYLSLKPCLMCAAMISYLAPKSCDVFYFADDPGPLAKNTELEKRHLLKQVEGDME